MKSSLFILMSLLLILTPVLVGADTGQTVTSGPPISQPLVREGTLAVNLADVLKVGSPTNEAEAESLLSSAGIAPRNGWIADYPVTPDIVQELRTAVGEAADSGRITLGREAALKTFEDAIAGYNLSVRADASGQGADSYAPNYYDPGVLGGYYYDEGPPIVTYYAPPPYYGYLYSWVPYPFWWWDFWFPGFFVLADFDFHGHHHDDGHHDGHHDGDFHDGQFHDGHFSNHFRDPGTGQMTRVDPVNRANGGTSPVKGGPGWSSAAARSGAQGIVNSTQNFATARTGGGGRTASTPGRSWASGSSSPQRTFGSPSGSRAAITGASAGRAYGNAGYHGSYGAGASGQTAYRTSRSFGAPSTGGRFYSSPLSSGRSFSGPSMSSRSFSGPSAGSRSFSGSSAARGSFGGSGRGFTGGGFSGGMRR